MTKADVLRDIGTQIGALCAEKNEAYGDAFAKCGEFLKLLYPNGIKPEQYGDALGLVRVFDKQMRIATHKDALGESPWRDIGGYGVLGAANDAPAAPTSLPRPAKVPNIEQEKLGDYYPKAKDWCDRRKTVESLQEKPKHRVIWYRAGREILTEFDTYSEAFEHYWRQHFKPGYHELIGPRDNEVLECHWTKGSL